MGDYLCIVVEYWYVMDLFVVGFGRKVGYIVGDNFDLSVF